MLGTRHHLLFARGADNAAADRLPPGCFEGVSITKPFSGKGDSSGPRLPWIPSSLAFRKREGTFRSRFFLEKPSVDLLWETKLVLFSLINRSVLFPKAKVALDPPKEHSPCCEGVPRTRAAPVLSRRYLPGSSGYSPLPFVFSAGRSRERSFKLSLQFLESWREDASSELYNSKAVLKPQRLPMGMG